MSGWWDVFMRVAVILNAIVALLCIGIRRYDLAALNISVVALWVALQAHGRGAADSLMAALDKAEARDREATK